MTWTKLSDDFTDRPEYLAVSRSARLLLIEMYIWSNRLLTDGLVPDAAIPRLSDIVVPKSALTELAGAGLVERVDVGYQLDWSDQPDAEGVRAQQARRAKNQKVFRDRVTRHADGDHSRCFGPRCTLGVTDNATGNKTGNETTPSPVPVSVPTGGKGQRKGKGASAGSASAAPAPRWVDEKVCYHGEKGGMSFGSDGRMSCPGCHVLTHGTGEGRVSIVSPTVTTDVVVERCRSGLGVTDRELAYFRTKMGDDFEMVDDLASAVGYGRADADPQDMVRVVLANTQPQLARQHEWRGDGDACTECDRARDAHI